MLSFSLFFASLFLFPSVVQSFKFSVKKITSCDDIGLTWSGGTPPYYLTMSPIFGTPRNITIPAAGLGSYAVTAPFSKGQQVIFTMSDATGFGSGGNSDVLTVGASVSKTKCDTKDPAVDFTYDLNTALQQCSPYTFSGYTTAVQPVTIMAIIPLGESVVLSPPSGPTSFTWEADVAAGTDLVFLMIDAQGRQGGASDVKTVGITNDKSCLNANSPTSTSSPKSTKKPTATKKASSTSKSTAASGTPVGAIIGTVVGALLAVAIFVTLGMFFVRRRALKRHANAGEGIITRFSRSFTPFSNTGGDAGDGQNTAVYPFSLKEGGAASSRAVTPITDKYLPPVPPDGNPFEDPGRESPAYHNNYPPPPSASVSDENGSTYRTPLSVGTDPLPPAGMYGYGQSIHTTHSRTGSNGTNVTSPPSQGFGPGQIMPNTAHQRMGSGDGYAQSMRSEMYNPYSPAASDFGSKATLPAAAATTATTADIAGGQQDAGRANPFVLPPITPTDRPFTPTSPTTDAYGIFSGFGDETLMRSETSSTRGPGRQSDQSSRRPYTGPTSPTFPTSPLSETYSVGDGVMRRSDTSARSQKEAEANANASSSSHKPARFILHTDLEDNDATPIVEVPPQYVERRPVPSGSSPLQQHQPYSPQQQEYFNPQPDQRHQQYPASQPWQQHEQYPASQSWQQQQQQHTAQTNLQTSHNSQPSDDRPASAYLAYLDDD